MRQVFPHLRLASSVIVANVWLLEDSRGRRFLVDTGHWSERPQLAWSLARAGVRKPGDLTAVLLTHRHSDHAGNAGWLRKKFDCPVICHEKDAPFLKGEQKPCRLVRGTAPLLQELICHFEDWFPARVEVDEVYSEGNWKWGFQIVPSPGHTEGSVMLHHEPTRTLFSGDSILVGIPPLRLIETLRLAVPGFSLDAEACHGHVRRYLKALPPTETLCSGHGPVVMNDTHQKLVALVSPRE